METLTEKLGDVLKELGRAFLVAGYLPAAVFVLAHQLFLFPRWLDGRVSLFTVPGDETWAWVYLVDQALTLLVLPLTVGILLMGLNTFIVRLYEGSFRWQRGFLLWPWQRRNERRVEALYGELMALKRADQQVLIDLNKVSTGQDRTALEQKRASLALELQREHEAIEARVAHQRLPHRKEKVKPTALGNAFALIEEYPYERYGMDGTLYWPRLRPLVAEQHAAALVNGKLTLDLLLNLSLLAGVFGIEAIVVGLVGSVDWGVIAAGGGALVLAWVCYRGGVSTVRSLGDTIALCFDFFRGALADPYGLDRPADLEAEQAMWLRLGQFLRRGESFYFPDRSVSPGDEA